jgi:hypothetical protein
MIRRLCREAVIFMLVGFAVAAVGTFFYLHHSQAKQIAQRRFTRYPQQLLIDPHFLTLSSEDQRSILRALEQKFAALPPGDQQTVLAYLDTQRPAAVPLFGMRKAIPIPSVPTTKAAFDHNGPYEAITDAIAIQPAETNNLSNALVAGVAGLYGFAVAAGIWLFYRLVYFAVKG